jgi:hypothetical protein
MLLTNTPFETGYDTNADFTAVMFLGCGVVVIHTPTTVATAQQLGYKLHTIAGRKIGFALFTRQV